MIRKSNDCDFARWICLHMIVLVMVTWSILYCALLYLLLADWVCGRFDKDVNIGSVTWNGYIDGSHELKINNYTLPSSAP